MKILFLATYFPRPLNPTIGTWALEQAKALKRNAESGNCALDSGHSALAAPSGALRVVSGNPWFPKIAGRMKAGIRVYSDCPRLHSWDGVEVDYLPMLFYPFGKLDAIFNRVGEPLLRLGWWSIRGRLMKVVEEFQPDIIYAHHTVPNGYFAFRIHKQTRIPYFVTEHDMDEVACSISFRKRLQVYEKVFVNATRVVAISKLMEAEMQKIVPSVETEVIYSP